MILYLSTYRRSIRALKSAPTFASTPFTLSTVSLKINSTLATTSPKNSLPHCPTSLCLCPSLCKPRRRSFVKPRRPSSSRHSSCRITSRHAEALSKLSEQHGNAIQEVQVQSEHRLTKQQTAHESVVAGIHAQHIRGVRQIVRKHTIVHNPGNGCSPSKV